MAGFLRLPIEVFQMITSHTPDRDLAALAGTCRIFSDALQDQGFWHVRLIQEFDEPTGLVNDGRIDWLRLFQARKGLLRRTSALHQGSPLTMTIVNVVKSLMLEAHPSTDKAGRLTSKNLEIIKDWVQRSSIIRDLFQKQFTGSVAHKRLLHTVLVCLAPIFFDAGQLSLHGYIYGFPEAQMAAYSNVVVAPIMTGSGHDTINMSWVLSTLHFFRYSILKHEDMRAHYEDLLCNERPQMWNTKLGKPFSISNLGKVWRGTYSYLDRTELQLLRGLAPRSRAFIDKNFENDNPIQTMKLYVPDKTRSRLANHSLFESVLKSLGPYQPPPSVPQGTKAKSSKTVQAIKAIRQASFPFEGIGWDEEDFYSTGWINPLPPQSGVPGFARMTMMKYFIENNQIDYTALWAYEGIILPGGQMMIGRWWSPEAHGNDSNQYSGPFIMWNAEGAWKPADANFVMDHRGLEPGEHGLVGMGEEEEE